MPQIENPGWYKQQLAAQQALNRAQASPTYNPLNNQGMAQARGGGMYGSPASIKDGLGGTLQGILSQRPMGYPQKGGLQGILQGILSGTNWNGTRPPGFDFESGMGKPPVNLNPSGPLGARRVQKPQSIYGMPVGGYPTFGNDALRSMPTMGQTKQAWGGYMQPNPATPMMKFYK